MVEEKSAEEISGTRGVSATDEGAFMLDGEAVSLSRECDEREGVNLDGDEEASFSEESAAREAQAVHDALVAVFEDVRTQSADSELVEPSRWPAIGLVPDHLTADDFEMFVYEYLEDFLAQEAEEQAKTSAVEKPTYRSASRAVGVAVESSSITENESETEASLDALTQDGYPEALQDATLETRVLAEAVASQESESASDEAPVFSKSGKIMIVDGEPMFVEDEEELPDTNAPIRCEGIALLQGHRSYYLYSREHMTDNYAHWSYLAHEDNAVIALVDCAREESRVYPRPMPAESLENPPFNMSDEQIAATWKIIEESGDFPDMETVSASNDEVYYFSTKYVSRAYAQSLAEWASVERQMNM
ncbi:MAG: hypothetical protein RR186_05235 [Raoultibacter sp.]